MWTTPLFTAFLFADLTRRVLGRTYLLAQMSAYHKSTAFVFALSILRADIIYEFFWTPAFLINHLYAIFALSWMAQRLTFVTTFKLFLALFSTFLLNCSAGQRRFLHFFSTETYNLHIHRVHTRLTFPLMTYVLTLVDSTRHCFITGFLTNMVFFLKCAALL